MKILVCGGRNYGRIPNDCPSDELDYAHVKAQRESTFLRCTLDAIHAETAITEVIHGAAKGADTIGKLWAKRNGIKERPFPADWNQHGRAAGHIRNQQMLDEGRPDLVVAFPGGKGTAGMVEKAKSARIPVKDFSGS